MYYVLAVGTVMDPPLIRIMQFLTADICGCGGNRFAVPPANDTGAEMEAGYRRSLLFVLE